MGEKETVLIPIGANRPKNRMIEDGSHSDESCPYPPGYGPCSNLGHVHHDGIREQELPFPSERDQREFGVGEGSPSDPIASAPLGEGSAVGDLCTDSDETRYLINQQAFIGALEVDNDAKLDECKLSSVLRQVCVVGEKVKENEFSGVPGIVVAFPTKVHLNVDEATHREVVLKGALSAHLVFSCKGIGEKETVLIPIGADGPKNRMIEDRSHSNESCPYPPGYGPCSNLGHMHHDGIREQELPFPSERDQRGFRVGEGSPSDPIASALLGEGSAVGDLCTDSDESRYLINQQAFIGALEVDNDAKLDECELSSVLRQVCVVGEQVKENEFSGVPGIVVAFPTKEHINVDEASDGEGVLKGALSGDAVIGIGNFDNLSSERWDSLSEELSDDDVSVEVAAARGVWIMGGVSFGSSDEEEVVTRMTNRRKGWKSRTKHQKQSLKPNYLEGRTLATRSLKLGSKL
ncbi:hypothetical protein PIB30_092383 [Stylosanthes scabra]|uniref:Uncharacterized protein n=1 Tax=Stylosanthes scabra TaxID=79078 RepID=A0ABU6SX93_9FABA|nr:hypothetical protein [Stylosanthes scabra]